MLVWQLNTFLRSQFLKRQRIWIFDMSMFELWVLVRACITETAHTCSIYGLRMQILVQKLRIEVCFGVILQAIHFLLDKVSTW